MSNYCPTCQQTYQGQSTPFCGHDGTRLVEIEAQVRAAETFAPPDSVLMFFFANHFVEPSSNGAKSTQVPCQNAFVRQYPLCNALLAIAFLHLREQGLIAMQIGEPKGILSKYSPVQIAILRSAQTAGLEGDLLGLMQTGRAEMTVEGVVYQHLGGKSSDPEEKIIARVVQWAAHLNYGICQKSKRPFISFGPDLEADGSRLFAPNCEKIMALTASAQKAQARWMHFQANEPALYQAIMGQCKRALSRRTYTRSDIDSSFSDF